jgi:putative transposase
VIIENQSTSRKFLEECIVLRIKQIFTSYNNLKGNANTEILEHTKKKLNR